MLNKSLKPTHFAWVIFITQAAYSDISLLNLKDAYQSALKHNELIILSHLESEEGRSRLDQITSDLFPKIALSGTYLRQDSPDSTIDSDLTSSKITLSQPVFRGFAEYAALRSAKAVLLSRLAKESHAKITLYDQVAQAFFQVLADEQDIKNINDALDLSRKRGQEIQIRVRSGRSRQSELVSNDSQIALLEAQLVSAQGKAYLSKGALGLITGLTTPFKLETHFQIFSLAPLEEYQNTLNQRGDIKALKYDVESAEEAVTVARGNHFPQLDLTGNLYLKRNGILANSRWDLGLTATFSLYSGGGIEAETRTRFIQVEKAQTLLSKLTRELNSELLSTYQTVVTNLEAVKALTRATDLAKKNFEALSKEFRFSQVTNLEVIAAQSQFYEAQRALDRMHFQTHSNYQTLNTTVERIE